LDDRGHCRTASIKRPVLLVLSAHGSAKDRFPDCQQLRKLVVTRDLVMLVFMAYRFQRGRVKVS
jgi:hypothetical protein